MGKVTVGIPALNEGRFLDQTLASLVGPQNYDCIDRIIISDNASTDNTNEIATAYAAKYPKIEVQRLEKTVPGYNNFMRLLDLSDTEYFTWIGGHDILSDNYFADLVPRMDARPEAVAAMPMVYEFKDTVADGKIVLDIRISTIDSDDVLKRVYAVLNDLAYCKITNSIWRTKYMKQAFTGINPEYINSDHIQAMFAAVFGPCVTSSNAAYYYRAAHGNGTQKDVVRRYVYQHQVHCKFNIRGYLPREYWRVCQKYAPAICSNELKQDIVSACVREFDTDMGDDVWLKHHAQSKLCDVLRGLQKPVALLGAGVDGYEARRFAEYGNKLRFSAFVRSSDETVHEAFAHDKIEDMDFLRGKALKWVVIVADEFHESERIKQLEEMGYEEHHTCFSFWDMLYPEKIIVTKQDRIRRALKKYTATQLVRKVIGKGMAKIGRKIEGNGKSSDGREFVIYEPKTNLTNKHTMIINDILTGLGYDTISASDAMKSRYAGRRISIANFNFYEDISASGENRAKEEYQSKVKLIRRLKAQGTKIITTVHHRKSHGKNGIKAKLQDKLLRLLLKSSDVLIVLCNGTLECFGQDYDKQFADSLAAKSVLIPPVSYKEYYKHSNIKSPYLEKIMGREGTFKMLFIGSIDAYKNIELLLDMMERVTDCDAHLTIWGGGEAEYVKTLCDRAQGMSNVTFRGEFIGNGAMWDTVSACDCAVLPYNTESMLNSGSVMLAASVGRNVIVPDIGTVKDMPEGLIYSYHYDKKDEHLDKLLAAFHAAYNDFKNRRADFDKRAQALCNLMDGEYSVENITPKYKELYSRLSSEYDEQHSRP